MFFTVHIATGLCTAYADPVSKVLGKNELVTDPDDLSNHICKFFEYKWIATKGVEDDMILRPYQQIFVRT